MPNTIKLSEYGVWGRGYANEEAIIALCKVRIYIKNALFAVLFKNKIVSLQKFIPNKERKLKIKNNGIVNQKFQRFIVAHTA